MIIALKSFLPSIYSFIIKQAIFKHTFLLYYTLFCSFSFLCSLPSSIKYAHVFGLSATTSTIIFPPNSSLKRPGTFLFLSLEVVFYRFHHIRCIKPSINNIIRNIFKKIFSYHMNNKAISICMA